MARDARAVVAGYPFVQSAEEEEVEVAVKMRDPEVAVKMRDPVVVTRALPKGTHLCRLVGVEEELTNSSPLEAHKSTTLVYHMVGGDVGFKIPTFACLEVYYEEADNSVSIMGWDNKLGYQPYKSDPTGNIYAQSPPLQCCLIWFP